MKPWLVFFDIDGTLLFPDGISPQNLRAIDRLRADGHKVFINTGRSRAMMLHALPPGLHMDGYVCGSAYVEYGGRVLHNSTRRCAPSAAMPQSTMSGSASRVWISSIPSATSA